MKCLKLIFVFVESQFLSSEDVPLRSVVGSNLRCVGEVWSRQLPQTYRGPLFGTSYLPSTKLNFSPEANCVPTQCRLPYKSWIWYSLVGNLSNKEVSRGFVVLVRKISLKRRETFWWSETMRVWKQKHLEINEWFGKCNDALCTTVSVRAVCDSDSSTRRRSQSSDRQLVPISNGAKTTSQKFPFNRISDAIPSAGTEIRYSREHVPKT
jgi:hypothetical protein